MDYKFNGSGVFFTSDTHFNHTNIIRFCSRPFKDVEHMNETLIANWNRVVGPDNIDKDTQKVEWENLSHSR